MGVRSRISRVRRNYSVQSPNDLWHIDGYHKLIPWHIAIHGGIDGYSSMIMFLQASRHNVACILNRGNRIPSRVRMDKGGENVLEAQQSKELDEVVQLSEEAFTIR